MPDHPDRPSTLPSRTVASAGDEVEVALVTMRFDAADADRLVAHLARYVVLTRGERGCRNVDLAASTTVDGRFLVVSKWDHPDSARAHFDGEVMVEMAEGCAGLLASPPAIDLHEGLSAHDLV